MSPMALGRIVDPKRIRSLRDGKDIPGPVVYWMSRDQRVNDNWALIYAEQVAREKNAPLGVLFCLVPDFIGAAKRQYDFMLGGLQEVEKRLVRYTIPFFLITGDPEHDIPRFVKSHKMSALITDFSPLKISRRWKEQVAGKIDIPFFEVDAHNIVPCWIASGKQEYGAYTIRPKLRRLLPEFLTEFPRLRKSMIPWPNRPRPINWKKAGRTLTVDQSVKAVDWLSPGETAAEKVFQDFLINRLDKYHETANDPNAEAQSHLSPYIHFGHISAQRVAFELHGHDRNIASQEAFLEQLVIRRELSDNFCFYNREYDSFNGFPEWARKTLDEHRRDIRPHVYSREQLERALTHDDPWNAAQMEMVLSGKMHGYMRMYWAKKILEWSRSPQEALATAIYLNDKYELDGRDPNGYAGIAWSIGGVHDRPWSERAIFGKIRYMSYDGCRRKFDVARYVDRIAGLGGGRSR